MAGTAAAAESFPQVDPSSIIDKVIVGYQGWFNAKGDGSPGNKWVHWSNSGGVPSPQNLKFEIYPDVREYPQGTLFPTGFAPLGNGQPAMLFSSYPAAVTDLHFLWMAEYGLDGAALQRFGTSLASPTNKKHRDQVAVNVKNAAEKYGRIFYIMYDVSGMNDDSLVRKIEDDWTGTMTGLLHITSSPQYAKQDGKPVVCLWGFGFATRQNTPEQAIELVDWFKMMGYYVIGGVPNYWRLGNHDSKPDFTEAYNSFDMISPWTVGRYKNNEEVEKYYTQFALPDYEYAKQHGIAYQPVMNPGYSTANLNGGVYNSRPRNRGELFWKQAYEVNKAGIPGAYIAMFDEYDEGTAIAKSAEDSSMIPTDQRFLTMSADGTYVSSDFYLRLADKATRMIEGKDEPQEGVPIPYSNGPVFFRTGLEEVDALPEEAAADSLEDGAPRLSVETAASAHRGSRVLQYSGKEGGGERTRFDLPAFDVNIPVKEDMKLSYWIYPETDQARYAAIDLIATDGTRLSEAAAVEGTGGGTQLSAIDGKPDSGAQPSATVSGPDGMQPSASAGKTGEWTRITVDIGKRLNGKTIKTISVVCDSPADDGELRGDIDDIALFTGNAAD